MSENIVSNTLLEDFIRLIGGLFSVGSITYFFLSGYYLFNLWWLVFFWGFSIFTFCSLMAFGLCNLKKWGRWLMISASCAGIAFIIYEGINIFGSLNRFAIVHIMLILILAAFAILFALPTVKWIMKF